jgi:hypothetical protein
MKIHIQPTSVVGELDFKGEIVPARIWEGETDSGVEVVCWITRVAARRNQDLGELEAVLKECAPPSRDAEHFPNRMIL